MVIGNLVLDRGLSPSKSKRIGLLAIATEASGEVALNVNGLRICISSSDGFRSIRATSSTEGTTYTPLWQVHCISQCVGLHWREVRRSFFARKLTTLSTNDQLWYFTQNIRSFDSRASIKDGRFQVVLLKKGFSLNFKQFKAVVLSAVTLYQTFCCLRMTVDVVGLSLLPEMVSTFTRPCVLPIKKIRGRLGPDLFN